MVFILILFSLRLFSLRRFFLRLSFLRLLLLVLCALLSSHGLAAEWRETPWGSVPAPQLSAQPSDNKDNRPNDNSQYEQDGTVDGKPHNQVSYRLPKVIQTAVKALLNPGSNAVRRSGGKVLYLPHIDGYSAVIHLIVIEAQLGCVGLQLIADL